MSSSKQSRFSDRTDRDNYRSDSREKRYRSRSRSPDRKYSRDNNNRNSFRNASNNSRDISNNSDSFSRKPNVCFNFQKGKCDRGESCKFSHEEGGSNRQSYDQTKTSRFSSNNGNNNNSLSNINEIPSDNDIIAMMERESKLEVDKKQNELNNSKRSYNKNNRNNNNNNNYKSHYQDNLENELLPHEKHQQDINKEKKYQEKNFGIMNKKERREEMKNEDSSKAVWGNSELEEEMDKNNKNNNKYQQYNNSNNNNKEEEEEEEEEVEKVKANFGLTGALAKDEDTGNSINGIILKFSEPLDSAKPVHMWRFYVFKEEEIVETLHIHRQSAYLLGRDDRVCDLLLRHPSCSKQHAVIQFRAIIQEKEEDDGSAPIKVIKPYLMDLGSTHKTYLNEKEIDDARYYELREKDSIRFGASSREYVLLHDKSSNL
jgi:smad nuclear-interacting protein 1